MVRPHEHKAWLKQEIPRRVAAGEQVVNICAPSDMPSFSLVYRWARGDPDFAAALKTAQAERRWRARLAFDPAKAAAFIARSAAGATIHEILRDRRMPSRAVYRDWMATQPEFAARLLQIRRDHAQARYQRWSRERRRVWDRDLADRLLLRVMRGQSLRKALAADPALPGFQALRANRRAHPGYDEALKRAFNMCRRVSCRARQRTPALREAILDHIVEGGSLHSFSHLPGAPHSATLYRWVADDQDFRLAVQQACVYREGWYADQIYDLAMSVRPGTVTATKRRMGRLKAQLCRLRNRPGKKGMGV